ncbi:ring-opening amidohydrolase [Acidihalobacter ferrooxydans]|uniref:Cyclic amide hydrolase n=1 Tax=Acidihalobacter ferrooxydans TaxID=1765967 RepID=A0A1P8UHL7_9GAMM|nr:ring-opening amidohydrolase [Acidihalobacter ferrooxydans]APZ43271.1 amidohydrolase [Acidihalobacter ferrooxydans]
MRVIAHRFPTTGPSDVSGLATQLDAGELRAQDILAIIGKTEGNGGLNDFTRELATRALGDLLAPQLGCAPAEIEDRVVLSFSGGTEGVTSPHLLVLARTGEPLTTPRAEKRLAVATGYTRAFEPWEVGYRPMIEETARVVRELMRELKIDDPADVHLAQIKGAIPDADEEQRAAAEAEGRPLRSDMVGSRAASALGVALALDEVAEDSIGDRVVCRDWSLYSTRASVSAKPGLLRSEITLLANSAWWDGDLVIEHGVMRDIIDLDAIRAVLARLGLEAPGQLAPEQTARLVGLFAKSDADPRNTIRGRRHTMWTDADISDMRYSRCVVAALLAGVTGETAVYVSTRAEHQGPLGGGPVAIIARAE